jgi:hypothetical protein
MWLRMLHIWFDAYYSLLSMLLCQKNLFMLKFMHVLWSYWFEAKCYVLIFKTCTSMTNICSTIGLYAKSFDGQISRDFHVNSVLKWPNVSAPCRRYLAKFPWISLSQFLPDMSGPWLKHIRSTGYIQPISQTCPALGSNISDLLDISSLSVRHVRPSGWRVYKGAHTPSNPRPLSLLLHFISWQLQGAP